MRESAKGDFEVQVDGIGTFVFGRRTMADQLKIAAEFSRLSEGVDTPSRWLVVVGDAVAKLAVLTVKAPDGWNVMAMDPLDDDDEDTGGTYGKILKVANALSEKERSFRPAKKSAGEGERKDTGKEPGVLDSTAAQPASNGPAVPGADG